MSVVVVVVAAAAAVEYEVVDVWFGLQGSRTTAVAHRPEATVPITTRGSFGSVGVPRLYAGPASANANATRSAERVARVGHGLEGGGGGGGGSVSSITTDNLSIPCATARATASAMLFTSAPSLPP